jgi:hypothetical protein
LEHGHDIHCINKALLQSDNLSVSSNSNNDNVEKGKLNTENSTDHGISSVSENDIQLDDELPMPTVIKMDVNGFELSALNAIPSLLAHDRCRLIYIEIEPPDATNRHRHPDLHDLNDEERSQYFESDWSFDKILGILVQSGFQVEYIMDQDGDLFIKGHKE